MSYRRELQAENSESIGVKQEVLHSDAEFEDVTFFGGLGGRMVRLFKKGDVHQGHCHFYDHITFLASGSVKCEIINQDAVEYKAPTHILVSAHNWHKFTALSDNVVFWCVFVAKDGRDISGPRITAEDSEKHFIGCSGCLK